MPAPILLTREAVGKHGVALLDVASGRILGHPIELQRIAGSLALTPDGKTVVVSQGQTARLWDPQTGKPLGPPLAHKSYISTMEFSPDGKTLILCSDGGESQLWDVTTKQTLGATADAHETSQCREVQSRQQDHGRLLR